jgi:hypothetical protein
MRGVVLLALLAVAGCSSDVTPVLGCDARDGIEPVCGFHNPEDLVATPSGRWLIVSEMAEAEGGRVGSLTAYDPEGGRLEQLFPVGAIDDVRNWGDPDCAPPAAAFAPHGIDLETRADGALQLLVVNHGGRESVEYFAVEESNEGLGLQWRGCVIAPDDAFLNDVVGRRDGGFWVTKTGSRRHPLWSALAAGLFGAGDGVVYGYVPHVGFEVVPGSAMPGPNGIAKSHDESVLFVSSFFGGDVRRLDLARGAVTGRVAIEKPDNLTWSPDGKLLVASHADSWLELLRCRGLARGACGAAFEVVSIDPDTLAQFPVLAHRGAPIGGVSAALRVGEEVFLGSFAGDRIARWRVVGETP